MEMEPPISHADLKNGMLLVTNSRTTAKASLGILSRTERIFLILRRTKHVRNLSGYENSLDPYWTKAIEKVITIQ